MPTGPTGGLETCGHTHQSTLGTGLDSEPVPSGREDSEAREMRKRREGVKEEKEEGKSWRGRGRGGREEKR